MCLTLTILLVFVGRYVSAEVAEPTVWSMHIVSEDIDAASSTGFLDLNGSLIINSGRDVQLVVTGSGLDNVFEIAFTSDTGKRGERGFYTGVTKRFPVSSLGNNSRKSQINLDSGWIGKSLRLIVFTTDKAIPSYQGLSLLVQDLSSLFLPIWLQVPIIIILLCLSSLFSGLNLGLMSLDQTGLKILKECGSDSEKRYAKAIEPLRKRGNFLLCTLLLGNVLVNTTLTLLLDQLIGSGLIAVIFSTIAIVIFGEIIPQAICSRYGLMVGAQTRYVTILFMALTGALSWPLSKVLDCVLGQEIGTVYTRDKLSKLLEVQRTAMDIGDAEVDILTGVLRMRNKKAEDIMTPIDDVFMVSYDAVLDFNNLNEIFTRGFSRIPVYDGEKSNVVNVLNVKDIAFLDPDDKVPVKAILKAHVDPQPEPPSPAAAHRYAVGGYESVLATDTETFASRPSIANVNFNVNVNVAPNVDAPPTIGKQHDANLILRIEDDMPLDRLLQRFLEKRCHMGFVFRTDDSDPSRDPVQDLIGLVTLEDLFEEIIQREILDEGDVQDRRGNVVKRRRAELREFNAPGPVSLSPGLHLAAYQFLSTTELFHPDLVSPRILMRLLKHKLVEEHDYIEYNTAAADYHESADRNYLYRPDRSVDYFVLILQGHTDVQVGREHMQFNGGPFQVFGESALVLINELLAKYPKHDIRQLAKIVHSLPKYKPDFKVRASTDLQYVKVDRATYLALRTRTITIKQLPSAATHAIIAETDELILKDVEIAKNPDAIPQSPTQSEPLCALDGSSAPASAPPATSTPTGTGTDQKPPCTATKSASAISTGFPVREVAALRATAAASEASNSPALAAKTGKMYMRSRHSIVNVSGATGVGSNDSSRRISMGDMTGTGTVPSNTSTFREHEAARAGAADGTGEVRLRVDNNDHRSHQSLPNAVDSYVNSHEKTPRSRLVSTEDYMNERMRLIDSGSLAEDHSQNRRSNGTDFAMELTPLRDGAAD